MVGCFSQKPGLSPACKMLAGLFLLLAATGAAGSRFPAARYFAQSNIKNPTVFSRLGSLAWSSGTVARLGRRSRWSLQDLCYLIRVKWCRPGCLCGCGRGFFAKGPAT
jgi:hypothetical protein